MYHVTLWKNRKIVQSHALLPHARRHAKRLGHTGEDITGFTGYPPIAYVATDNGDCAYNPRFSKRAKK